MPDKKEFTVKDRRTFAKGDEETEIKEEKAETPKEDAKTEERTGKGCRRLSDAANKFCNLYFFFKLFRADAPGCDRRPGHR